MSLYVGKSSPRLNKARATRVPRGGAKGSCSSSEGSFVEPGKEYAITCDRFDVSKGDVCFGRSFFCFLLASKLVPQPSGTTLK